MKKPIVFLIDVDNTLLNNDLIKNEIEKALIDVLGKKEAMRFWYHHDEFRKEHDLVDFPNVIRRYCAEKNEATCETRLNQIFNDIDFKKAIYPNTFGVLDHLKEFGTVTLFTEGDAVYQKMKVEKSGLAKAVDAVYLFQHKFDHLHEVLEKYPGYLFIFIDDRADKLAKMKREFPRSIAIEITQGHYGTVEHKTHGALDMTIEETGDLLAFSWDVLHHLAYTSTRKSLQKVCYKSARNVL